MVVIVTSETATVQPGKVDELTRFEDGIDLRSIWFVMVRRKLVFAAVVALVLALTLLISSLIETVYTAGAKVILDQPAVEIMDDEVAATPLPDSTAIDTQVQLFTSRSMLADLVRKLNLVEDPEFNPYLAEADNENATWLDMLLDRLPGRGSNAQAGNEAGLAAPQTATALLAAADAAALHGNAVAAEAGVAAGGTAGDGTADRAPGEAAVEADPARGTVDLPEAQRLALEARAQAEFQATIDRLMKSVNAYRDGLTFVIAVTASSRDADKSAVIANALAEVYIENQLRSKVSSTRQAGEWLTQRLDVLRDELQAAEKAVEDYRIVNGMVDTAGVTTVEAQIAELTGQLVLLETDLADQQARMTEIRSATGPDGSIDAATSAIDSTLLTQLRGARAAATRTLADIRSTKGPSHPDTVRAGEEIEEIDAAIDQEIGRVIARQESALSIARNRVADVRRKLGILRGEQDEDNVALIRLRQLEREAAARRSVYEALLTRAEEVTEQELLQRADARILSLAEPPSVPSAPNHKVNLLIGALAALALATLVVILLELFESGFASGEQVEKALGLPVLAAVAEAPRKMGLRARNTHEVADYMAEKPKSAFTESIRSLYAALHRNRPKDKALALAVTSTLPGEGKTSLSLSLARLAAGQGDRVVLIDADLRRRSISKVLSGEAEEGFREALEGKAKPRDLLVSDPKSSAMVLPAPTSMDGHMSVVLQHTCRALFDDLKRDFDLVIIDCPPVLPVMEARTIAAAADATIFAIRWRQTHRKAVRQALRQLLTEGALVLGGMLTRTNLRSLALYDEMGASHYKKYASYYRN